MQEQVHLEQSPDRRTMRRFLACQNSILEKGASEGGRVIEGERRGRDYKWGKFRQKAKPYNLYSVRSCTYNAAITAGDPRSGVCCTALNCGTLLSAHNIEFFNVVKLLREV